MTEQNPPLDELADDNDTAGWDRGKHGTFADHAADDGAVPTMNADDYLRRYGPVNGAS